MIRASVHSQFARKLFNDLKAAGTNLQPTMEEVGEVVQGMTDLAFRRGREPFGAAWAPLKPSTIAKRRKGSATPLRDTGILANSFMIQRITASEVDVGSMDKRAGTHMYGAKKGQYGVTRRGSPIPWGDIPARPMLPDVKKQPFKSAVKEVLVSALKAVASGRTDT